MSAPTHPIPLPNRDELPRAYCQVCDLEVPLSALTHAVNGAIHGVIPVINVPQPVPAAERDITFAFEDRQTWTNVTGADPRGTQWSSPGIYVVARRANGQHLTEVKLNYALRRTGEPITTYAARQIIRGLEHIYYPNPVVRRYYVPELDT